MNFGCVNIGVEALSFFEKEQQANAQEMNKLLRAQSGIVDFFEKEDDYAQLKQKITTSQALVCESRIEYGDFQTSRNLSFSITEYLFSKKINPQILVEPTCGKGSFILSSVQTFSSLQQIFGIEIQEQYLWC